MKKIILFLLVTGVLFLTAGISADNCYICGSGSTAVCKDYCKYQGSDSFETRKKCEHAGCKVSGTASCPTAVNYKVCSAANDAKLDELLACGGKK